MIVFGTDGWRGEIARDFTFENLSYVAQATAAYATNLTPDKPSIVIGYDARFLSREFAEETACILASQGVLVHLANSIASTPQVSFAAKQKKATLGVVITASHNPPNYNGYKIKGGFGGPAFPEQIKEIEALVAKIARKGTHIKFRPIDEYIKEKTVRMFNAKESYLRYLKRKIDVKGIIDSGMRVAYDPMHGAGINTIDHILPGTHELHGDYNPSFGDVKHPEPMAENLLPLIELMKTGKFDVGFATDGDADRLGAVDETGRFIDSHRIFMLLLKYLYEDKRKRGAVAKTVSLTAMVDKYCKKHNLTIKETPVGFKYISRLMVNEKILVGGEESGGIGTSLHIPERDGIFNALLLMEMMVNRKKTLSQLCEELDSEFGLHRYRRRDVKVTQEVKERILAAAARQPKKLGRYDVERYDGRDGHKFFVDNGWLLIRASGTEPLLRYYAEADSLTKVNELLDEGMKLE